MGTNREIVGLQGQIKTLIAELGWSQNQLARILYTELHDWDDEEEIVNFQERFKKDLQRSTTKEIKLRKYLSIIVNHPEAKKMDIVLNKPVRLGSISETLSNSLDDISKEIDKVYKASDRTTG